MGKYVLSFFLILLAFSTFFAHSVNAQTPTSIKTPTPTPTCQAIYGGGTNCATGGTVIIDKTVENPNTQEFTNALLQDMYVFSPRETVTFRFTITNVSSGTVSNIHILDALPANLDYVKSDGSFNSGNRTVSMPENALSSKTSASFQLTTKVNSQPIPGNQPVACIANIAQLQTTSFFFFNHIQSGDTAIFCLKASGPITPAILPSQTPSQPGQTPIQSGQTKGGQKVYPPPATKKTPATGPEAWSLFLLPALFFIGRKLRKLTK